MTKADSESLIVLAEELEKKAKIRGLRAQMAKNDSTIDALKEEKHALWCAFMAGVCRRAAGPKSKEGSPAFEAFWLAYPARRKTGKGKCRDIWKRKGCDGFAAKIMATLEKGKRSIDWTKEGGDFTPMPTTWLNREGWDDEFTSATATTSKAGPLKDPEGWKAWLVMQKLDYREYWRANPGIQKAFNERKK